MMHTGRRYDYCMLAALALLVIDADAAPGPPNLNKCNNKNSLAAVTVQGLSFGDYEGTIGGTVTVTPTGARSTTGPVLAGGIVTAAAFDVSNIEPGCDIYPVQITLPATATLTTGAVTMTADTFVSSPANQFMLSPIPGQPTRVYIGATLNSGVNQTGGAYTTATPFDVIFEHVP